jgi:hypothetical protein
VTRRSGATHARDVFNGGVGAPRDRIGIATGGFDCADPMTPVVRSPAHVARIERRFITYAVATYSVARALAPRRFGTPCRTYSDATKKTATVPTAAR